MRGLKVRSFGMKYLDTVERKIQVRVGSMGIEEKWARKLDYGRDQGKRKVKKGCAGRRERTRNWCEAQFEREGLGIHRERKISLRLSLPLESPTQAYLCSIVFQRLR